MFNPHNEDCLHAENAWVQGAWVQGAQMHGFKELTHHFAHEPLEPWSTTCWKILLLDHRGVARKNPI